MKRIVLMVLLTGALAGCGADGEPVRPTAGASVTITPSGVHTGATVGVVSGPVSIGISL